MARVAIIGLNAGTAYLAYLLAKGNHRVTMVAGARDARLIDLEPHVRHGLLRDNRLFTLDFLSTLMDVREHYIEDTKIDAQRIWVGGHSLGYFDLIYTGTEDELVTRGSGDVISSSDPFLALMHCMVMRAAGLSAAVSVDVDEWILKWSGCERRSGANYFIEAMSRQPPPGGFLIGLGQKFVDAGGSIAVVRRGLHEVLMGIGEAARIMDMGTQRPIGFDYAWAGGVGVYVIGSMPSSMSGMSTRRMHAVFGENEVEARVVMMGDRVVHAMIASRGWGFTLRDAVDVYRWIGGDPAGFLFDIGNYQSLGRLRGIFSFIY